MFTAVIIGVVVGVVLTLAIQAFLLRKWFRGLPLVSTPIKQQFEKFSLPKELKDALQDPELKGKKESCVNLNLLFQFLFQELKDTKHIRRWVMKRMNAEFAEMLQTTTGKLLDQITVRDFTLGSTFPIVKHVVTQDCKLKEDPEGIEELTMVLDIVYSGGFQLAVDVDLVFGKSAFLSVKVTNLKGVARMQLCHNPFTHWSFTFIEDPTMEFQVESQFEGRPVPQITSLIVNQIRRSIRKKHTLPNYKIRYRPFFIKPEPKPPPQDIYYHGNKLSSGHLQVTVIECSRLVKLASDSFVYCTLAVDSMPWRELVSSRKKLWVIHEIEIIKGQAQNIGLTFKDEFIHDKFEEMVVVETVMANTPAGQSDIKKNDIVIAVAGTRVTSMKHVVKLIKQAGDRFTLKIERSSSLKGINSQHEFKFEEDTVSLRDEVPIESTQSLGQLEDESEDYINITVTQTDNGEKTTSILNSKGSNTQAEDKLIPTASPRKTFTIPGSGLFQRKKSRPESRDSSQSPKGSPELKSKMEHRAEDRGQASVATASGNNAVVSLPVELVKKRSQSDPPAPTQKQLQAFNDKAEVESLHGDLELPSAATGGSSTSAASEDAEESNDIQEPIDLQKTKLVRATQDPVFQQKFDLDLDDSHNFLNMCIWCRIPEKLDKQNRVVKPEKDILIGHTSISLMEVALECLATLQGDSQQTYTLTPADMKAGASRTKLSSLASHPGFDKQLCFGDITLGFQHTTQPLSKMERRRIDKIRVDNEQAAEKEQQQLQTQTASGRTVEEGKHDFVNAHFQSATYCNFCHKKIWLKAAFQCQQCKMICHKKCIEKCQAQTLCTKNGFQFKHPQPQPQPQPQPSPTTSRKSLPREEKEAQSAQGQPPGQPKSSFLSKFRKESPKFLQKEEVSKGLSPNVSPKLRHRCPSPEGLLRRRRRNSAPNENGEVQVVEQEPSGPGLLSVSHVPRTRSSTSLQDLIRDNASPSLRPNEVRPDSDASVSSDEEEEMNLLKFFEQRKSSHNADEMVVTAAKEMGKELYAHLSPEERKEKLDNMVNKLQLEIDQESEHRGELARLERGTVNPARRTQIKAKLEKSDEKIQSLALLMLHYCAGLQNCLDLQEEQKQESLEEESEIPDGLDDVAEYEATVGMEETCDGEKKLTITFATEDGSTFDMDPQTDGDSCLLVSDFSNYNEDGVSEEERVESAEPGDKENEHADSFLHSSGETSDTFVKCDKPKGNNGDGDSTSESFMVDGTRPKTHVKSSSLGGSVKFKEYMKH